MEDEKSDLEQTEDDLIALLKGKLKDGSIKSMDTRILLDLLEKRDSKVPQGPPIPGLLQKLPFAIPEPHLK